MPDNSLWIILHRLRTPFLVLIVTYSISIIGLLMIPGEDGNGNIYNMTIFDAWYFVSYTATTIGFGDTPYTFTYHQRMWISIIIYLTVIGWFYSIGSVIAILQDKHLLSEIAKVKFIKQVKNIKQPFVIILGYSLVSSEIIRRIQKSNFRVVVIENNEDRANSLILEGFSPRVPVCISNVYHVKSLEDAGIKKSNCKAIISLFKDDNLNLRVAILTKYLNPNIQLVVKSNGKHNTDNLLDVGVDIIQNPFSIISYQIQMALEAPSLLKLEQWIYNMGILDDSLLSLPKGKYLVCGYGRMGRHLYNVLNDNNIKVSFLEINEIKQDKLSQEEYYNMKFVDADDRDNLINAGILDCDIIIAGTDNDTVNLSILATARKLNSSIITIARENELEDYSIFKSANIDHIFMPSKILIHKTTNAIVYPLSNIFVKKLIRQDEKWGDDLVKELQQTIGENPKLFEITINKWEAPQIYNYILKENLTLDIFRYSLYNQKKSNKIVVLIIKNEDNYNLLPQWNESLHENDTILFACDEDAIDDIEYITQNIYEFNYILTGKDNNKIFQRKLI